ncbi:MAG: hypothetical protein EOO09_14430 [Chitinophagaceae bacterium]|nr:MAG: hypothetical protein EOO09_14430 [Chitinophagaceae bacterium]
MYTVVTFSYLLLPLALFLAKGQWKSVVPILLAAYGIFCFTYLYIDAERVPKAYQAVYAFSFTSIEYLVFAGLFFAALKTKSFRQIILGLSAAFLCFQVFSYLNNNGREFRLDTISIGIETILVFVYTFLFFYENMKSNTPINLYNSFAFWIAVGILTYLGVSFFLYILANDMNNEEIDLYWPVTFVAETIKNLVFCVAILKYGSKPNDSKKNLSHSQGNVPHLI